MESETFAPLGSRSRASLSEKRSLDALAFDIIVLRFAGFRRPLSLSLFPSLSLSLSLSLTHTHTHANRGGAGPVVAAPAPRTAELPAPVVPLRSPRRDFCLFYCAAICLR